MPFPIRNITADCNDRKYDASKCTWTDYNFLSSNFMSSNCEQLFILPRPFRNYFSIPIDFRLIHCLCIIIIYQWIILHSYIQKFSNIFRYLIFRYSVDDDHISWGLCWKILTFIITSLEPHHTSLTHSSWIRCQGLKRQKSIIFSRNIKSITKINTINTSNWIYRFCEIELIKFISRLDYQKYVLVECIHFYLHNIIASIVWQGCIP
jgi:hypothetical protein